MGRFFFGLVLIAICWAPTARADERDLERDNRHLRPSLVVLACGQPYLAFGLCLYGEDRALRADRSEDAEALVVTGDERAALPLAERPPVRTAEVELGVFGSRTIVANDLTARLWMRSGLMGLQASWTHAYMPGSLDALHLDALDVIVAARYVEVFSIFGASVRHDDALGGEWTPAFEMGAVVRIYPRPHFTVSAETRWSLGYDTNVSLVSADTRALVGAVFGRIDVRAGVAWQYQRDVTSAVGPMVSLLLRL